MKRIVVCCDGTWNEPGQLNDGTVVRTNVQKVFRYVARKSRDGLEQRIVYIAGVGVDGPKSRRILDGAVGRGLDKDIMDAYQRLIEAYEPGDEIFLFGFSRGAYTARSLAGLINNCGVLNIDNFSRLQEAYEKYRDRGPDTHPSSPAMEKFRATYGYSPRIRFIGVWDTVGALGLPLDIFSNINTKRYQFHDVQLSSITDHAFHALAIDEKRMAFAPTLWVKSPSNPNQVLEQVWFPGVHSDVGGGYATEDLSDVTLKWMMTKAAQVGLAFRKEILDDLKPEPTGSMHNSLDWMYRALGFLNGELKNRGAFDRNLSQPGVMLGGTKRTDFKPQDLAVTVHEAYDLRKNEVSTGYIPKNADAFCTQYPNLRHDPCSCDHEWQNVVPLFV